MVNKEHVILLVLIVLIIYYGWYYTYYYKNSKDINILNKKDNSINKINIFASNKDDIVKYNEVDANLLDVPKVKNNWEKALKDLESDNTEIISSQKLNNFLKDNDITSSN